MPSTLRGEIIGRGTMLAVALTLLLGGHKCLAAAAAFDRDAAAARADGSSPPLDGESGLPRCVGWALVALGSAVGLLALLPVDAIARLFGPPRNTTLGEDSINVPDDCSRIFGPLFWHWW